MSTCMKTKQEFFLKKKMKKRNMKRAMWPPFLVARKNPQVGHHTPHLLLQTKTWQRPLHPTSFVNETMMTWGITPSSPCNYHELKNNGGIVPLSFYYYETKKWRGHDVPNLPSVVMPHRHPLQTTKWWGAWCPMPPYCYEPKRTKRGMVATLPPVMNQKNNGGMMSPFPSFLLWTNTMTRQHKNKKK